MTTFSVSGTIKGDPFSFLLTLTERPKTPRDVADAIYHRLTGKELGRRRLAWIVTERAFMTWNRKGRLEINLRFEERRL